MKKLITILFLLFSTNLFSQQIINACEDNLIQTYIANGLPNSMFSWNVTGGSIISNNNSAITVLWPDSNGTFTISVMEISSSGCIGPEEKITVIIRGCFYYYFPNSFTPNGDNLNEVFNIEGYNLDVENFELMIFDRWGEQLFTTTDVTKGWDGKYKGVLCKQDVYVYKCIFKKNGKQVEKTGQVNLIR